MPPGSDTDLPRENEKTNWEWRADKHTVRGVSLGEGRIVYWEQGPHDQGGALEQSALDYLAFGPREELPEEVREELETALRARAGAKWPELSAAAKMHREKTEQDRAEAARAEEAKQAERIASYAAAKRLKDPWRSYAKRDAAPASAAAAPADPWLRVAGWSLAIHAVLLAAAIALGYWSVYVAGFFVLFAGVILMIMAPIWFGAWALSGAAIFAAIGAIGAVLALDRARELSAGEIVRDVSVADAPRHPTATGFVFNNARVLSGRSGSYRHVAYRTHGSGPAMQVSHYVVAPIVPMSWAPGDQVPAWAACHGTYESDCLRIARIPPAMAVIVRRYDRDNYYVHAVNAALQRHGMRAAQGAPILRLAGEAMPGRSYWAAVVWAQPAAFALWLALFAGWRLWRRLRPRSAGA